MNVWAIDKEIRIKHFLIELVHRYGENTFALTEHPDQHQAVEVFMTDCPELSAYVYTFAQSADKYGIDLKFPLQENNIVGENENLTLEQIFSLFNIHFDLINELE